MSEVSFDEKTTVVGVKSLIGDEGGEGEQRTACLIVLEGSQAGKMFRLDGDGAVVGRSQEAGITLVDEGISRKHARFEISKDGTVTLVDLGSTNGTFCNGEKVNTHRLADGDKLQIGTATILKFSYQDSVEEAFFASPIRERHPRCPHRCLQQKILS